MTASAQSLRATLETPSSLDGVERDWRDLESRSDRSFFMSWSWIGNWLGALPAHIRPELLRVESQGRTVALGILVGRLVRRHGVFLSRALFLNSTGDPHLDEITIEYNGLLCERGFEQMAARRCVEFLFSRGDWDEWFLDGIQDAGPYDRVPLCGARWIRLRQSKSHYVDLSALRCAGGEYVGLLGSNTRYNIRRSVREYEKLGPLEIESANTIEQACTFLSSLSQLHQAYWQQKGLPGSFANPFFNEFHAKLVRSLFAEGSIQLLRLRAGDGILGYLYNFVDQGRVYNYQSGYDYQLCPKQQGRPGLVTHVYAVEFNRAAGHHRYDFMAGDSQYKQALGLGSTEMVWLEAQRSRLRFALEDCLGQIRSKRRQAALEKREVASEATSSRAPRR
jgi:CelD/BcsL family acetyltransferase involved in cellulose biosynthesis